ncbi:DEAD/DEAH box helicase [Brevibacillus sp. H7]|uniref:DEAD/DEAH box helicase n=1 Tax=Brevibacillus sp. H7 TaxID=3349138 RepID=UPI0038089FB8
MSVVANLYLTAERLSDGHFLVKGTRPNGAVIAPEELAGALFAWDESSFYGTFLNKTEDGIRLRPCEALSFFSRPQWLEHIAFTLDEQMVQFQKTAVMIQEALAAGNFAPHFEDWKDGRMGFKLIGSQHSMPPYANSWLTLVLSEFLSGQGGVRSAWNHLCKLYPALSVMGEDLSPHLQETEWLQSIGWLPDDTPFRTCLQVAEAENSESDWHLQFFLQDKERPDQVYQISPAGVSHDQALPSEWLEHQERFLRDVQKCSEILPWLTGSDGESPIRTRLTNEQAWSFLTEGSLQLVQAGIHVFLPAWWEKVRRARPKIKAKVLSSVGSGKQSYLGISQVMEFEWKLANGSVELDEEEFRRLLEHNQRLVKVKGQWIQLTPDLVSQIQKTLKKSKGKHAFTLRDAMRLHLLGALEEEVAKTEESDVSSSLQVEVELNQHLLHFITKLQEMREIPILDQPSAFRGTLRQYQLEGSSWLLFLRQFGLGACLADDMGLGKTVQFISYLLHLKETESFDTPSLLICPTSVIGNWQKELERFAPSLKIYVHYGNARKKQDEFPSSIQGADLVITSYALSHLDGQELSSVRWNTLCLDEAQHIKNAYTKQASAIRNLHARHRIALTGTPIENRLTELWSIFDFLNPGYLGSLGEFTQRFVLPIERSQDQKLILQVQRLIQPFLLRRVKTDPRIQLDLPEKNEGKEYVPLTAEQGALYESTIHDMFARLDDASPMERRGLILTTLTRLKQLCDHPGLVLHDTSSPDEKRRSNKIERLLELVEDIRRKGERCLIFTQYIEMGNLLRRILESEGHGPVFFLNGSTPKDKRDEMIEKFQDTSLPDHLRAGIFILSLRAGGTGLNLTEANHVFHMDRWWNPAVENQATDRAYRIGQQRHVQVYKFIALGTIEERIDEMMENKLSLSHKIVGSGESWITELSTSELRELFTLRHDWLD